MDSTVSGVLQDCGTSVAERKGAEEGGVELRRARFETAWRQNVSELFRRSLIWTSGRREDAEDALGQAALIALMKWPHELQAGEARGWLLRLVYSKCMDIHRHRRRARYAAPAVDDSAPEVEIEASGPGLEATLLESELLAVVRDRIQALPPRLRQVAELHLLRDMPYAEIADLLVLTEVNARKRMQEARALLREHLRAYLAGDPRIQAPRQPARNEISSEIADPAPLRHSGWTLEALERYVQLHPQGWKKRWELAVRLREAGRLEEAAVQLREAAIRQPRRMELWLELGATLRVLGRNEEAREAFETAMRRARDEGGRARVRIALEKL
jgi:RNA polymerase sigma-70 factor (ECF subfamily)